jgi:hypothetical protein
MSSSDLSESSVPSSESQALIIEGVSSSVVDGSVDTTSSKQGRIGSVYDGISLDGSDCPV